MDALELEYDEKPKSRRRKYDDALFRTTTIVFTQYEIILHSIAFGLAITMMAFVMDGYKIGIITKEENSGFLLFPLIPSVLIMCFRMMNVNWKMTTAFGIVFMIFAILAILSGFVVYILKWCEVFTATYVQATIPFTVFFGMVLLSALINVLVPSIFIPRRG
jgi:hypothetical protein